MREKQSILLLQLDELNLEHCQLREEEAEVRSSHQQLVEELQEVQKNFHHLQEQFSEGQVSKPLYLHSFGWYQFLNICV